MEPLPTPDAFRTAFPEFSGLTDAAATAALQDGLQYYAGSDDALQLLAGAHAHVVRTKMAAGEDLPTDVRQASSYGKMLAFRLRSGANALPTLIC